MRFHQICESPYYLFFIVSTQFNAGYGRQSPDRFNFGGKYGSDMYRMDDYPKSYRMVCTSFKQVFFAIVVSVICRMISLMIDNLLREKG